MTDELPAPIANGACSEVFACGAVATAKSIGVLADRNQQQYVRQRIAAFASELRAALLVIQARRAPDPSAWTYDVRSPDHHAFSGASI